MEDTRYNELVETINQAFTVLSDEKSSQAQKETAEKTISETKLLMGGDGFDENFVSEMKQISTIENDDEREAAYDKLFDEADA